MALTMRATPGTRPRTPMDPLRRTALVAGALYVLTFATSIPAALLLKVPALDPAFILGTGDAPGVVWGNLLDVVNALACIGTAVVLFGVLKRQSESLALAFVAARVLEAAVILVGVASLLSVVTLREELNPTTPEATASLLATGHALVALHDGANVLGPGLVPAINGVVLGAVLLRSGLVPRLIPVLGIVGGPLLLASWVAVLFGATEQFSAASGLLVAPIFVWELSLGIYLVVRGFRPSPVTAEPVRPAPGSGPAGPAALLR